MARTLRARLTLWNLTIVASALALFAVLLYLWLSSTLYGHHDDDLLDDSQRIADRLSSAADPMAAVAAVDLEGATRPLLLVRNGDGSMLFRSRRVAEIEPEIGAHTVLMHAAAQGITEPQFFTVRLARGPARFICIPLRRPAGAYLQYGRTLGDVDQLLDVVLIASAVLVPVIVVLTSFGGFAVAKRALRPVDTIAASLESIQATNLARRVDPHSPDAEVTRLTASINRLLDRLHTSFNTMKEFTADISHQLHTPLTVLKGNLDLARQHPESVRDLGAFLETLKCDVDAVHDTLKDLRDYALADAESAAAHSEPVDVSHVFEEAGEVVKALAEAHGIECRVEISPRLYVWGNAVRLRQVILNLGENAVQFTASGGRIAIAARQYDNGVLQVTVRDTGVGIAADVLPYVFDRHFHGKRATGSGSGLGLAIVKRIVDGHGGSVRIQSTPNEGTSIIVALPTADRSAVEPAVTR